MKIQNRSIYTSDYEFEVVIPGRLTTLVSIPGCFPLLLLSGDELVDRLAIARRPGG
jgi:hypothetical protein